MSLSKPARDCDKIMSFLFWTLFACCTIGCLGNVYHKTNCVEHCKQELNIDAEGSTRIKNFTHMIEDETNSTILSQNCQNTEKYVVCLEKNCDIAQYRNSNDSKMQAIYRDFSDTIHKYRMTSPACENAKEWSSAAKCIHKVFKTWNGSDFVKPMYYVMYDVEKLGSVCKAQLEVMPQIEEKFSKSCGKNASNLFIRFYKNAVISFAHLRGLEMSELSSECNDFLSYVDVALNDYKASLYYKIAHYVSSVFGLKQFMI
ncbi:hypothetical protein DdX_09160 [Ditylenchus destructor]|uniref:Uncharacterized protein n=1 Tax=Ditylenchus destructor TaxID=166010 RepID=A0AAD4N239_9BILA|nr:hypothetical protein DdX_09160 [Ditylenchus destructor]